MNLDKIDLEEIVMKLAGPIDPTFDSGLDKRRLCSLDQVIELIECLLARVSDVAGYKDRHEDSVKRMGIRAAQLFERIKNDEL